MAFSRLKSWLWGASKPAPSPAPPTYAPPLAYPEREWIPVKSSNLAAVRFESIGYFEGILDVKFVSGSWYRYTGVPKVVFHALMSAHSHGVYHYHHIRMNYPFRQVA